MNKWISILKSIPMQIGVPEKYALVVSIIMIAAITYFLLKLFSRKSPPKIQRAPLLSQGNRKGADGKIDYRMHVRHFERVAMRLKTLYQLYDVKNQNQCTVVDMSRSGLGFICSQQIDNGSRVKLYLPDPAGKEGDKEFLVSGEVVRSRALKKKHDDYEYGVRFYHMIKPGKELVELLIEKHK